MKGGKGDREENESGGRVKGRGGLPPPSGDSGSGSGGGVGRDKGKEGRGLGCLGVQALLFQ